MPPWPISAVSVYLSASVEPTASAAVELLEMGDDRLQIAVEIGIGTNRPAVALEQRLQVRELGQIAVRGHAGVVDQDRHDVRAGFKGQPDFRADVIDVGILWR